MLIHPTLDLLREMKLHGMARAYAEQNPHAAALDFDERFALLVETERAERDQRQLKNRLKQAQLRQQASFEDLDLRTPRGMDRGLIAALMTGRYLLEALNVLIIGATGLGKTYLACALGHHACRRGHRVRYFRLPRLLQQLALGHADGTFPKLMRQLLRTELVILDDWGLSPLTAAQARDLLEVIDDRQGRRSTVITSQRPITQWHELFDDPTVADAILDRLVHGAYRIELAGESMRKKKNNLTETEQEQ